MTKNDDTPEVNNNNLKSRIEHAESNSSNLSVESEFKNPEDFPHPSTLPPLTEEQDDTSRISVPPSPELTQVLETIQSLSTEFKILQQGFDSKIKYDANKERIIDTLHKELQTYREGLHFKILRPLFFDLIAMHDDLNNLLQHNQEEEASGESLVKLRQSLTSFQKTIEGVLERYEVIAYIEEGEEFVAQRQRAIKTITTNLSEMDRRVADRIRKGFAYEGKILRPEIVAIFKFVEKLQTEN